MPLVTASTAAIVVMVISTYAPRSISGIGGSLFPFKILYAVTSNFGVYFAAAFWKSLFFSAQS